MLPGLNKEIAIKLLSKMLKIRLAEEGIAEKYSQQKMRCPTHLSIGQEAIAAAVGLCLRKEDQVFSTHRAHAHYLGKNGCLNSMIAEIYGKATGCSRGKGGSMHLIDLSVGFQGSTAIVGNSIPLAVGAGLSNKIQKNNLVACAFFGDGSIEEGAFHEALNFAILKELPVLFVCENNFYSVYSPLSVRQPPERKIWKFAEAYGVKSLFGDGNNVEEAYNLTQSAMEYILSHQKPVFLELVTYRWREHCGPNYDNHIGYRTPEEFEEWKKNDPLMTYKEKLLQSGRLTLNIWEDLVEKVNQEIIEAFAFAEDSPFPEQEEMKTNLFATTTLEGLL